MILKARAMSLAPLVDLGVPSGANVASQLTPLLPLIGSRLQMTSGATVEVKGMVIGIPTNLALKGEFLLSDHGQTCALPYSQVCCNI